jgi:hypothetical protein
MWTVSTNHLTSKDPTWPGIEVSGLVIIPKRRCSPVKRTPPACQACPMRPSIPWKDDWFSWLAPNGRRNETSAIILQQGIGEEDQGVWVFVHNGATRMGKYSAMTLSVTKQDGQNTDSQTQHAEPSSPIGIEGPTHFGGPRHWVTGTVQ